MFQGGPQQDDSADEQGETRHIHRGRQPFQCAQQCKNAQAAQQETGPVEGLAGWQVHGGNQPEREDQADDAQRDVEKEDPVPVQVAGNEAAQRRCQHRRDQRRPDQIGHGDHALVRWGVAQHQQTAHRHHQGATGALEHTQDDEGMQVFHQAATQRSQREAGDGAGKHASCAVPVGHPAADRDEGAQGQQVGADGNVQLHRVDAERATHVRQCGCNDVAVQHFHEHRAGDEKGHQAQACGLEGIHADCLKSRESVSITKMKNARSRWASGMHCRVV